MQPHELFTGYHTFDLTEAHIHILNNPRRLVALVPKAYSATGEKQQTITGVTMKQYLVTQWEEILIKEL